MAEARNFTFGHTELAELLIKHLDIHEGLWGIYFEFGLLAANIPTGPDGKTLAPAAINAVNKVGIQRFEQPNSLTVDASIVNPAKPSKVQPSERPVHTRRRL